MDVVCTAIGMGLHGALNATQAADFGRKGMIGGGANSATGYLLGRQLQDDENPTVGGAFAAGFLSGSIDSTFQLLKSYMHLVTLVTYQILVLLIQQRQLRL